MKKVCTILLAVALSSCGGSDSTSVAVDEANDILEDQGYALDLLRIRSFPFGRGISNFIDDHEHVIVMEQNRDAQMRSLLILDLEVNPSKLFSILHYDGNPIYANLIVRELLDNESSA